MKWKNVILVFCCSVFLLSACGKETDAEQRPDAVYGASEVEGTVVITTHAGFFCEYQLHITEKQNGFTVSVLQPDSVNGIMAVVSEEGTRVVYEDVSIDALLPEQAGYSPVDAVAGLVQTLRQELPANSCYETFDGGKVLSLEYIKQLPDGSESLKKILLDGETLALRQAELYLDGDLILAVQAEDFSFVKKEPVASDG